MPKQDTASRSSSHQSPQTDNRSAMRREPVETANAPMDWKRIAFAGVGAAAVTVVLVYTIFKVFGIAQGASTGDVVAGNPYAAAQQVAVWSTLILSVITTFAAALWSVRETAEKHLLQGFLVGLIAAIIIVGLVAAFVGGGFGTLSIITFVATLIAGTAAGFFGQ